MHEVELINCASSKVEGLEVSLTISLKTVGGSLEATLLECGCHVNNIFIKLVGGASWLYQRYLFFFYLFFPYIRSHESIECEWHT